MKPVYLLITPHEYQGAEIILRGAPYHHFVRVRHLKVGTPLRAALPDGRTLHAEISAITPDALHAHITGEETLTGISPCRITLYQAVLKGEKMDLIIQKATELGTSIFVPLMARNSIPRWTPAQALERTARWQRIADAATEQCERSLPMRVEVPLTSMSLGVLPSPTLLLHEREGENLPAMALRLPDVHEVGLLLGPEGGWDDGEVRAFRAAGAIPIHLGRRVLRAETASIVAITLAQYLWGDLGGTSLEGE